VSRLETRPLPQAVLTCGINSEPPGKSLVTFRAVLPFS
jgi:hypothetical protein